MKELNNTKIIAVDHGYGNIKTANTVTKAGITAYDTEPVFSGNVLEYGGRYYRIGEGHKEFIQDKCSDDDYYLFTLMGIARELHREGITQADVHLAAGLPLKWVRRQRGEQFTLQIVEAVKDSLVKILPPFLAGMFSGIAQLPQAVHLNPSYKMPEDETGGADKVITDVTDDADVDWDFIGG